METRLIYTIGQRDVQILCMQNGEPISRYSCEKGEVADRCRQIQGRLEAGAQPNLAVLDDEPFRKGWEIPERAAGRNGKPFGDLIEEAFCEGSGVYFCFPIYERAVRFIAKDPKSRHPITQIDFVNTNRQRADIPAEDRGAAARLAAEPFAFQDLMRPFTARLLANAPAVNVHVPCEGQAISDASAFEDIDHWLTAYAENLPKKVDLFLSATAGIPAINQAIKAIAPLHLTGWQRSLHVLDQDENWGVVRSNALNYARFYRSREVVLRALDHGDFELAAEELKRNAMGRCPKSICALVELAAAGISADIERITRAYDRCKELLGEDRIPPLV